MTSRNDGSVVEYAQPVGSCWPVDPVILLIVLEAKSAYHVSDPLPQVAGELLATIQAPVRAYSNGSTAGMSDEERTAVAILLSNVSLRIVSTTLSVDSLLELEQGDTKSPMTVLVSNPLALGDDLQRSEAILRIGHVLHPLMHADSWVPKRNNRG